MGYAARAKQQARLRGEQTTCGNPEPVTRVTRTINRALLEQQVQDGFRFAHVAYSDRQYTVDLVTGEMRRRAFVDGHADALEETV